MGLNNRGVIKILKQTIQRPQQDFKNNEFKRNGDRCYYYGEPRHIKQNCSNEEEEETIEETKIQKFLKLRNKEKELTMTMMKCQSYVSWH